MTKSAYISICYLQANKTEEQTANVCKMWDAIPGSRSNSTEWGL